MAEPVDVKKLAKSPFTVLFWIKTIMFMLGMTVILSIGYGVYKYFNKKPQPTQNINVQPGGVVQIKNEQAKKNFYIFTEPYVGVDTKNKNSAGIRVGVRWEF